MNRQNNSHGTSYQDSELGFWLSGWGFLLVILICTSFFIGGMTLTFWLSKQPLAEGLKPNEMGDTAGAVNSLFSALAFAGVVFAIFMQRKELQLQREELKQTREELAGQREEFEIQNDTMKRQRFENTFFNMLQLQQQITDNISFSFQRQDCPSDIGFEETLFPPKLAKSSGREVFREAFETVIHEGKRKYRGMRELIANEGLQAYENNYTPTYFDHYFRHLYRIFKYVAESPLIKDPERYEYASMARAQLSRYELVWLFYNGLSENGKDKFKPLIEDFAILKNLREDLLVIVKKNGDDTFVIHPKAYSARAYRRNF